MMIFFHQNGRKTFVYFCKNNIRTVFSQFFGLLNFFQRLYDCGLYSITDISYFPIFTLKFFPALATFSTFSAISTLDRLFNHLACSLLLQNMYQTDSALLNSVTNASILICVRQILLKFLYSKGSKNSQSGGSITLMLF